MTEDLQLLTKTEIVDKIMSHILRSVRSQGYVGIADADTLCRSYMRMNKQQLLNELHIQRENTKLRLEGKLVK